MKNEIQKLKKSGNICSKKKGKKNTYRTVVSCGTFGMAVK